MKWFFSEPLKAGEAPMQGPHVDDEELLRLF
jgi:hypothetical protein